MNYIIIPKDQLPNCFVSIQQNLCKNRLLFNLHNDWKELTILHT